MRRLLHALTVAAIAAGVLAGAARADSLWSARPTTESATVAAPADPPADVVQRPALYARVLKPFGAAVRVFPSADSPIVSSVHCGDLWPVLDVADGWVKVRTTQGTGWIGGGRVLVSPAPETPDCSAARSIAPAGYATTQVASGCLSLRARPSSEAPMLACVENGHLYAVLDGPFNPGSGHDWFKVTSTDTGTGWALAAHLYPR